MPKLIFAGLDSAGKTTIHKHTIAELNIEESIDSKPTRGIDRHVNSFLDSEFSIWDLGGQKSYRDTYLSRPEVFNSTKAIIFVVDIQDQERFDESYEYYLAIMNIVLNIEPKPKVYVLFHKYDPALAGKLRQHFYRATKLFRQADKIGGIRFTGFATSIYSNSIQKAVKRILWENIEGFEPNMDNLQTPAAASQQSPSVPKIGGTSPTPSVPKMPTVPKMTTPTPSPTGPPTIGKSGETDLSGSLEKEMDSILTDLEQPNEGDDQPETVEAKSVGTPTPAPIPVETPKPTIPSTENESVEIEEKPAEDETIEEEEEEEESLVYEEVPDLADLSQQVVDKLSGVVQKRMGETDEIIAIAILGLNGKIPLAVAKSEVQKEKLEIVRNVVEQLNPKQFFKDLGDVEYRGLGHLQISDFDIYFARLNDENAIAILANDVSTSMLDNAQRIVTTLRQGVGMADSGPEEEEEPAQEDLIGDLKSRLSRLSSLHSMDD